MRNFILVASLAGIPVAASGQDSDSYTCTHGELVRRVVIMSEPGFSVPCQVDYYKDTEAPGESQILYSAEKQAGYCEEKTAEFIAKLEGWGWSCSSSSEEMTEGDAPEEAVTDDTDALTPVESLEVE